MWEGGKESSSDSPLEDSGPLGESGSVCGLGDKGTTRIWFGPHAWREEEKGGATVNFIICGMGEIENSLVRLERK